MRLALVAVLLLLLAANALADASVTRMYCKPKDPVFSLNEGNNTVSCYIEKLSADAPTERVFNVRVTFSPPQGIELAEGETETKLVPFIERRNDSLNETQNPERIINWEVNATAGDYVLANRFTVEWDDSISLELGNLFDAGLNATTQSFYLNISGTTDNASFCDELWSELLTPDGSIEANWSAFLQDKKNCNTKIVVSTPTGTYETVAQANGSFTIGIPLSLGSGQNSIDVTAVDPSGNSITQKIVVNYTPKPMEGYEGILPVIGGVVAFIFVAAAVALWLSKKRTKTVLETTFKQKEQKEIKSHLEELKARKKAIKKSLDEINAKSANVGLSADELARQRAYENELVTIEDELLKNDDHLSELRARAAKALEDARAGKPAAEIKKQLDSEGYSDKELERIKKFFQELKKGF